MTLCLYHNWSQPLHVYIGPLDTRLWNRDDMPQHCFSLLVSISLSFKSFCSIIITFVSSSLSHILLHISCAVFLLLDSTSFWLLRRHITCFVTFLYWYTYISSVSNCLCIIKMTVTILWWIQFDRPMTKMVLEPLRQFKGCIIVCSAKLWWDSTMWIIRFIDSATPCIIRASHHVPCLDILFK